MDPKENIKNKAPETQNSETPSLKKTNSTNTEKEDIQNSSTNKSGKNGG